MQDLRTAVALLTRLPVGRASSAADLRGAGAWFPLVGLLVGLLAVAVRAGLERLVGPVAATAVAVLATIAVTGALHEDGLADSADGLWGGSDVDQRLAIMRDSRLGTHGTIALVGDLGLRTTLLGGADLRTFAVAVVAGHVLGRLAPLALVAWLPPARPDGLGMRLPPPDVRGWLVAGGTAAVIGVVVAGAMLPALAAATAVGTWGVGRLARTRLGGVTGDLLGAGVRVSALLVVAVAAAMGRGPWVLAVGR